MNPLDPREEEIIVGALELPDAATRAAFLADACEGDAALRARIEAQLEVRLRDGTLLSTPTLVKPPDKTASDDSALRTPHSALPRIRYFGDYELLEEIARGGMGVVWRARQVSLNRLVAVKMILAGKLADAGDVRRFRTEAEAAANLQHPNIVAIHEVGEHEGQHYFSMDFVAGQSLASLTAGQPRPPTKAAQYVKTIAEAVHYAHQRGVLHRDLKPQNVMIDEFDQPRVTDFGLAKRFGVPPSGGEGLAIPATAKAGTPSSLTITGSVMGSPSYMPPEQATGRHDRLGPHSDVYSLGAILYELLTGQPPFRAENPVETLRKVVDEDPLPPSRLAAGIHRDIEAICLKCLEKNPANRYPTARELADDLGRFTARMPVHARPASPGRRLANWVRRHPWVLNAAASCLIVGLTFFAFVLWTKIEFLEWSRLHPDYVPTKGKRTQAATDIINVGRELGFVSMCVGVLLKSARLILAAPAAGVCLFMGFLVTVRLAEAYVWEGSWSGMSSIETLMLFFIGLHLLQIAWHERALRIPRGELRAINDLIRRGKLQEARSLYVKHHPDASSGVVDYVMNELTERIIAKHPDLRKTICPTADDRMNRWTVAILAVEFLMFCAFWYLLGDLLGEGVFNVLFFGWLLGAVIVHHHKSGWKLQGIVGLGLVACVGLFAVFVMECPDTGLLDRWNHWFPFGFWLVGILFGALAFLLPEFLSGGPARTVGQPSQGPEATRSDTARRP